MGANKTRHQILHDFVVFNKASNYRNDYPISRDILISLDHDKNISERSKAVNFLLAYKYLIPTSERAYEEIAMQPKGFEALNSEYFLHEDRKEKREMRNHNYTLAFGIVTAIGVIFAVFKDVIKPSKPQEIVVKMLVEQPVKKLDSVLNSTPTDSFPKSKDSTNVTN